MALSEEENVCGFDDGFLVEECEAAEKIGFLVDFDDSKSEKGCEDVVDNLPNDPFGMELNMGMENDLILVDFNPSLPRDPFGMDFDIEVTFAAITGLIEDFGLKAYGFETDEDYEADEDCGDGSSNLKAAEDEGNDDNKIFAELNFVWTRSMEYEREDRENELVDAGLVMYVEDGTSYGDSTTMLVDGMDDLMCFGCEKYGIEHVKSERDVGVDIIIFVLDHLDLGIKDLLSIERVCRSLCDAVRKDPYLWTSIHIDYPLSQKITNEDLLRLTDRAQGKLRCLSLFKCLKISKDGLMQVLERNLEVTKLSVAGSSKLNGEGFLNNLKIFNSVAVPGIKHLRIGDPIGLTNEHLNEYKILLGTEKDAKKSNDYKPRYYCAGEIYLSLDDERTIDIEICPRCQKLGQVYDCPTENCQVKIHSTKTTKTCRACISCIARCIRCGCCLDNKAYEETFCFDFLCFDCLGELFFLDGVTLPPGQTYVHQRSNYHFLLYS